MNDTNSIDLLHERMIEAQNAVSAGGHSASSAAAAALEQPWTPELVITLSVAVFAFGLIICMLMTLLVSRGKSATDLLRLFSLPLIIVSAVVLVIAGYSDRQISSVIGLLGTIAGYLLGSRGGSSSSNDESQGGRGQTAPAAQAAQLAELETAMAKARAELAKKEKPA
jgi:hypothetical protein